MAAKKASAQGRERIARSLAQSFPGFEGDYEMSSAYSLPERRRLLGEWEVVEHTVGDRGFLERFAEQAYKGTPLAEARYQARYRFKDAICIKRVAIDGLLQLPSGTVTYSFRLSLALTWDVEPGGIIRARPELGYQSSSLEGAPAAVRELEDSREAVRIAYRFEGEALLLEEGEDRKRLRRTP